MQTTGLSSPHLRTPIFMSAFFREMAHVCRGGVFLLLATISLASASVNTVEQQDTPTTPAPYQPTLQPSPSAPAIGTYILESSTGKLCLKATMGVVYLVVIQKKAWYFNMDPSMVLVSGDCGNRTVTLSLTLPNDSALLRLTYTLDDGVSYVSELTARISPQPVGNASSSKTYTGELTNTSLWGAPYKQSYSCASQTVLVLTEELQVQLGPVQVQAFSVPVGDYGQAVKCQVDFNPIILPTVIGATAVGLVLVAVLTYLVVRDRRVRGYERI